MSLETEINAVRSKIKTDGYPMSIGEWLSLYENDEIDIHPEFQRFFRWTDYQKTALIESILLGIPIPPIFVSQREDGVWDVVDGLQRLSTIYQFMGVLKDEDKNPVPPLVLESTRYLPALKGKKWGDSDNDSLSASQQRDFKRSKISVSIILKESDERSKFELFQRLNSGGTTLTPQELRNCLLVMLNREMFVWLKNLAASESFQSTIAISDRLTDEQYDLELALRFLILRRLRAENLRGIKDVNAFLTDEMVELAKSKIDDLQEDAEIFGSVFTQLDRVLGANAFRRFDPSTERYQGGFSISAFEAIAIGLAARNRTAPLPDGKVKELIQQLWSAQEFNDAWGAGISASSRIPRLVPLGRLWFGV